MSRLGCMVGREFFGIPAADGEQWFCIRGFITAAALEFRGAGIYNLCKAVDTPVALRHPVTAF